MYCHGPIYHMVYRSVVLYIYWVFLVRVYSLTLCLYVVVFCFVQLHVLVHLIKCLFCSVNLLASFGLTLCID